MECEVKWHLGSITTNKANGGDGIPDELFKILRDDAVKVLHSLCQQIWKTQQWPSKESMCNTGDLGLILGSGRSPGEGKGYPLQYCGLENSMDCIVYGVTKSWIQLSNLHWHCLSLGLE